MNINTNSYQAFSRTSFNRTNQVESNDGKPAPPLTTNCPHFIGSEETGNMNPVNTSPQSKNSYLKTNRPYITPDNGSAAAMQGNCSVPAETRRSFDTNHSKFVAHAAVPHQQNVIPNNFQSTTHGREHF